MFSNKKKAFGRQEYSLETFPTVKELGKFFETAQKQDGVKHVYIWEDWKNHRHLTLTILNQPDTRDFEWWMYERKQDKPEKMLWYYKTGDLSVIYQQILQTVGAENPLMDDEDQAAEKVRQTEAKAKEESKRKSSTLGDRFGASIPSGEETQSKLYEQGELEAQHRELQQAQHQQVQETLKALTGESEKVEIPGEKFGASARLTGDLKSTSASSILRTAYQDEVTGHMLIEGPLGTIKIQFGLGSPVHAESYTATGSDAVIELFGWKAGHASFKEGLQPENTSVQDTVEELIRTGENYKKNLAYLQKYEINKQAILQVPPVKHKEDHITERLKDGDDFSHELQKRFVQSVDGVKEIEEILKVVSLSEVKWVDVVVNLFKLGLILTPDNRSLNQIPESRAAFQAQAGGTKAGKSAPMPPKGAFIAPPKGTFGPKPAASMTLGQPGEVWQEPTASVGAAGGLEALGVNDPTQSAEQTSVSSEAQPGPDLVKVGIPGQEPKFDSVGANLVLSNLTDSSTGVLSQSAFHFFLEREFVRAFRFSTEFTLMLFCIQIPGSDGTVPSQAMHTLMGAVSSMKREVDCLGQFSDSVFGFVLPGVNSQQSCALVDRLCAELPSKAPELATYRPSLHFGIASVPIDSKDLDSLVSAAGNAMVVAAKNQTPRVLFRDLGQQ